METGYLNHGKESRSYERSRDEILLHFSSQIGSSWAAQNDGRCNDARQHGQSMLKAQKKREQDGHLVIESKEW